MEPIQVTPPPEHYAGLVNQPPGVKHGSIEVIADQDYGDRPEVVIEIHLLPYNSRPSFYGHEP